MRKWFLSFLSQRFSNFCLYWTCWCTDNCSRTFGGAVDLQLLSSLRWSVQRCWLLDVVLPTEKVGHDRRLFIACDHFLKGLRMQNLLHFIRLFFLCKYAIPYRFIITNRSFDANLAKIVKIAKAWGSHGCQWGCSRSFISSSFFLNFSELAWHLLWHGHSQFSRKQSDWCTIFIKLCGLCTS